MSKGKPLAADLFSQKIYWLRQLAGELPETTLPGGAEPVEDESVGVCERLDFAIPPQLAEKILKVTAGSHLSIYVFLLAALKILLYKYTRAGDVIVESPVVSSLEGGAAGRSVPLRSEVKGQESFRELLFRVKATAVQAYSNQAYPLDQLTGSRGVRVGANCHARFAVAALLENVHAGWSPQELQNDITFSFNADGEGIDAGVFYDRRRYTRAYVSRAVTHYQNILAPVLADPDIKISKVKMLSESERHQLLVTFNDNSRNYPTEKTIHELFMEQAGRTPQSIAAVFNGAQLTYSELDERSSRLARLLLECGVRRGDFVSLLIERNLHFLISVLGVFKAGAAYLPIDPAYPADRIRFMLSNSETPILLTQSGLLATHGGAWASGVHLQAAIVVDARAHERAPAGKAEPGFHYLDLLADDAPRGPLEVVNSSKEPAYMLYTSGSTGTPKGAIIRHDGAVNHIYAQFEALGFTPDFKFLQSAPSSSDISVWQFLAPLLIGGRVVIADGETVSDPARLFRIIKDEHISIIELVPAVLNVLLDFVSAQTPPEREFPDLRVMMVTGEAAPVELVNAWLRTYPSIPVVNCYGPTEASDDVTQMVIEKPLSLTTKTVPIGKPLANIAIYILDPDEQLVAVGLPGELCVAGVAVGDGYWKNVAKTRASFIPNPFACAEGEVIYKTGDLGRWLPDGNIEFLGRVDHQVKIRGFRIETGEVEATLLRHPGVRDVVVVAREDETGERRLVAYWVPSVEPPTAGDLRAHLREQVPEHMVPSLFVVLEALPLLPNGKVDRHSLPAPDFNRPAGEQGQHVAPRTPIEEVLAGEWSRLLRLAEIGVSDNFFELGGHSLLATQVASRVRETFKVEMPLRTLFENPTVAELASWIEESLRDQKNVPSLPLRPVSRDRELPLSFAQQRLWFLDRLQPGQALYNLPAAVRLQGSLDVAALQRSFDEVVRRHEVLRTSFQTVNGQAQQLISPARSLPLQTMDLQGLSRDEQETEALRLITELAHRPFDLTRSPLLRVALLKLGAQEHVLQLTMHHIISDGWSMAILIQELLALYQSFSAGAPSPLPDLPIQYADFTVWQREWLQGEVLEAQCSYWRKHLRAPLTVLELPIDRPRSARQSYRGAGQTVMFPLSLLRSLRDASRQLGVTLFMLLLAGFQILLHRYSGQEDVIVGADVANRNRAETEGLIGFFVNMLVMRTDLSGNPTVRELLARVRQVALEAYANQDVPFEKLVEELQPERTLSRNPLFQVVIVLQNMPSEELHIPGLVCTPLNIPNMTAKFDLILSLEEKPEGLSVFMEYNTDLFEPATISRLLAHFQNLLESMARSPDQRLSDLRMISFAESGSPSPADFPGVKLSQKELEGILMEVGQGMDLKGV